MSNNLKPSIVLSGFVSSFVYEGEIVYLITYNSNGKSIDKVEDTMDAISIQNELRFNKGLNRGEVLKLIYDHKKSSHKIVTSIEQVEFIISKFKVFIFALVGGKSELYFSNFDESNKIEVLNWKSTLSIKNLSIDEYEKYIQNEQNN
jgi:hypothetical protein